MSHAMFAAPPAAEQLRCEYMINPLGIDHQKPRLSWIMNDAGAGARQTAYQVLVGTDSLQVLQGKGSQWNSGRISSSSSLVIYSGKPLDPFTKYFWTVIIWNQGGQRSEHMLVASFETAMLSAGQWKGTWISDNHDIDFRPAPYFRKSFNIQKKIKSARAYVAAAGLFELYVNGQPIGDHFLDPMYTRFDRRTIYVVHDVTKQLNSGLNAVGVILGNGWYNHQPTAVWYFDKAPWRARPAFCMDLRITYEDGTTEVIGTGRDWKTHTGSLVFNSIYTGEFYDGNLEQQNWSGSNFSDTAWHDITLRSAPSLNIVSEVMAPVRNTGTYVPRSVTKMNDTSYVFDFGVNISGVCRLNISGQQGDRLFLKYGERLDKQGHVDQSNIDVHYRPVKGSPPFQTDMVILKGGGMETFTPMFNYKGFQYVEVTTSRPLQLDKNNLEALFLHSDVTPVSEFSTSNQTINKIWKAVNQSYLSNLFGYPTDCPQREKNGWTGDAHIAMETGLYNFDGITVYEKWMRDHQDEQQPNGVLPSIIPSDGWGYDWGNGPDWTSTIAIVPWNLYKFYGDTTCLSSCYENIKRYVDHINDVYPSGLTTWGLGDWVPVKTQSSVELTSSIFYYNDVTILAKAAHLFGKKKDADFYGSLAKKIKTAINRKYLDKEQGVYAKGSQTELSMPLYFNVVPDALKAKVSENLARKVVAANNHIDVGLLGTKTLFYALSENGYADLAYKIASQEDYPSWGWWIKNGATTLYENWDIHSANDISLNHIMFGEIGAWFFKALAGIQPDESHPGFDRFFLKPHFVSGLDSCDISYSSPKGRIRSYWRRAGEKVIFDVTIPANTTGMITRAAASYKLSHDIGGKMVPYTGKANAYSSKGQLEVTLPAGSYNFELIQ